jgi:hypothetical protein
MRRSGWFCVNSRNDDAFGSRLSREGRSSDGGREIKTILYIFVAFQGISIVNSIIESRNAKTLELSSSGVSSVIGRRRLSPCIPQTPLNEDDGRWKGHQA